MRTTVLGAFDRIEKAELAADVLSAAGLSSDRVVLSPAVTAEANRLRVDEREPALPPAGQAVLTALVSAGIWSETAAYALSLGWTVIRVEADDADAALAANLLREAGAVVQGLDEKPP